MRGFESYHQQNNWLSDLILGGQDGLVNVLGIILGVTAANGNQHILLAATLAAGLAEAVSMAAVSYTSQLSDKDHFAKEQRREYAEVETMPEKERAEIREIYKNRGFDGEILDQIVNKICANKDVWVANMMSDELGLEPVTTKNIVKSAFLVGLSAVIGSLIPIIPFFFMWGQSAVLLSLFLGGLTLFIIGAYKAVSLVGNWFKSGLQMLIIGLGAALVGFIIGKILGAN